MNILIDCICMMMELTVAVTAEQRITKYAFFAVFRFRCSALFFDMSVCTFSKTLRAIIGSWTSLNIAKFSGALGNRVLFIASDNRSNSYRVFSLCGQFVSAPYLSAKTWFFLFSSPWINIILPWFIFFRGFRELPLTSVFAVCAPKRDAC